DVMNVSAPHIPFIPYKEFDTGHGKLSAHLDLRDEKQHAKLLDLVRGCDVFSQGYRPDSLANRGLSPTDLAALRPGIVCVSMCAFGHTGPWASRRGFDTAVQVVSGIAARQGELFSEQDAKPQFYPVSAIDYLTGYLMAFGALVALRKRTIEGGSWLVRLSLAQVGRWLQQKGELSPAEAAGAAPEFADADLANWMMSSDTPMGHLTHLAPVVQFSETPARWERPSVPLGYSDPVWPAR
ncbi:MAG: CoA transferase, partial [Rhodospirillaceae bacterium]|nr:CoA transferase [Rhodospirillaceae bacterium]